MFEDKYIEYTNRFVQYQSLSKIFNVYLFYFYLSRDDSRSLNSINNIFSSLEKQKTTYIFVCLFFRWNLLYIFRQLCRLYCIDIYSSDENR